MGQNNNKKQGLDGRTQSFLVKTSSKKSGKSMIRLKNWWVSQCLRNNSPSQLKVQKWINRSLQVRARRWTNRKNDNTDVYSYNYSSINWFLTFQLTKSCSLKKISILCLIILEIIIKKINGFTKDCLDNCLKCSSKLLHKLHKIVKIKITT